jgi:hypothetical protein
MLVFVSDRRQYLTLRLQGVQRASGPIIRFLITFTSKIARADGIARVAIAICRKPTKEAA